MKTCPECKGAGSITGYYSGLKVITLACGVCKGEKTISEEQLKWVEHGERLRAYRKAHDRTLREDARLRGIKASELSYIEAGAVNNLHIKLPI